MDVSVRQAAVLLLAVFGAAGATWSRQQGYSRRYLPRVKPEQVDIENHGYSGHHFPARTATTAAPQRDGDLVTAAQTYAPYQHMVSSYQTTTAGATTPHHHPTTYSPFYPTEAGVVHSSVVYGQPAGLAVYHPAAPAAPAAPTAPPPPPTTQPTPTTPAPTDIHQELQMQLSQQIQVQLQQLQKLHELQHKMLRVAKTEPPTPDAIQQAPSHVVYRQQQPQQQQPQQQQPQQQQQHTTPVPLSVTPSPPPVAPPEPHYPEESPPLTAFLRGESRRPFNNGFMPIAPLPTPSPLEGADTDFQPFTEDATDPALPFYLLPPAHDSDSHYHRLRESSLEAPGTRVTSPSVDDTVENTSGPSGPPSTASVSSEQNDDPPEQLDLHDVQQQQRQQQQALKQQLHGKHGRLTRGEGCVAVLSRGGPSRVCAAATATAPRRRPTAPKATQLRIRIRSPIVRFHPSRDAVGAATSPLVLRARAPGRPPVTILHAVQEIRVINKP